MFLNNLIKFGLSAILSSTLFYFGYFTSVLYFKKKKYAHVPGPEPKGLRGYFMGNLSEALRLVKKGTIFPVYLQNCFEKYGPLFKIQMFDRFIIYTIDPEIVKTGLIVKNFPKFSKIYKQVGFPYNERFLGQGLITETNYDIWKHRRALFQTSFGKKLLMNYAVEFDARADRLIKRLNDLLNEDRFFDLKVELAHTTIENIASVAFGMHLDCLNDKECEFTKNIRIVLDDMCKLFNNPLNQFKPNKTFREATNFLRELGREQIIKRINALKNNDYVPNDILFSVLAAHYHEEFELEKMVDDFLTFFVAGAETLSSTLSFCFWELHKNPHILKKLKNEIDQVIGSRQQITYNDIEDLEYTGYVFKETLRLWPVAPSINRIIPDDIKINGIKIPKNTEISFSTFCAHRNPKYFTNPDQFIPERFKIDPVSKKNSIHPYTYFPFSLGPRNCIGQNFAAIEAKMILAKVLQNFEIIMEQNQNFEVEYVINLRFKHGLWCKLKVRN